MTELGLSVASDVFKSLRLFQEDLVLLFSALIMQCSL